MAVHEAEETRRFDPDGSEHVGVPRSRHRGRVATLRLSVVETLGRAVAVVGVVATIGIGSSLSLTWIVVLSACWLLAVQVSMATRTAELHPLGPSMPAARGALSGLVGASAVAFWFEAPKLSMGRMLLGTIAIWALVVGWQTSSRRLFGLRQRILLIGNTTIAREIVRELEAQPAAPFDVLGVVEDGTTSDPAAGTTRVLGTVCDLPEIIERKRPDIVVVAVDRNRPTTFGHLLDSAAVGFRVVEATQFFEHAFGRVPVRDVTRSWFMSVLHLYQRPYSRVTKRVLDILVASVGLLLTLPLVPFLAFSVKLSSGPLLLRQTRVGEHGRPFTILKFRTMRVDAEEPGRPQWSSTVDPRVTRVGRFMRRFRLDELPQFINVLRGEMSIVGPRPERPEFMEFLEERVPFWTRRHLVKPGITGWAQVRRGYASDADGTVDKLSYDLWYLRHRSILVDVVICVQTFRVLVGGSRKGAPDAAAATDRSVDDDQAGPTELVPAWGGGPPKTVAGSSAKL